MPVKHITLVGSFGASNIGDEAILESTLQMLRRQSREIKIHILSATPADTQEFYKDYHVTSSLPIPLGIRSIIKHCGKFIRSLKILKVTDVVFFPGGGLFTDNETIYAVLLWGMHFFFFKNILRKKVVFSGQSVGPLNSFFAKRVTSWVLRKADKFIVRDEESLTLIKNSFPKSFSKIELLYDPVCFIDQTSQAAVEKKEDTLHIALSLRPWHGREHHLIHMIGKACNTISTKQKLHVHLVPMQYKGSEDTSPLQHMSYVLHEKGIDSTIHIPKSYKEVLNILNISDIAIGMRLHFLILSAISKTPLLALSYSTKVEGFLKRINLHSFVDITNIHQWELEKAVIDFTRSYHEQETYLDVFTSVAKNKKRIEADLLLSSLGII